MRIDILTIFPKMFEPILKESIIKRAQKKGKVKISLHNLRDYTLDRHKKVDDRPFGGGSGMVMKPEPIFKAVEDILRKSAKTKRGKSKVILLSPKGERLTQELARRLSRDKHLIFICGHYEGVDERIRRYLVTEEISVGDYILTGGELPAMILVDCIVRLIPGVLGDRYSLCEESFSEGLLEYPQYTRPAIFRGMKVPLVLLSGNHKRIEEWRKKEAIKRTRLKRPDLLKKQ